MAMSEVPRLLLGTLVLRPYVFAFLLLHLVGATALLGWRRAGAFTLITWGVALAAEHSSIRTGIPFGWYYYISRTADQELWIAGVPFFDSLSFSFLLVASYGLAWFLLAGGRAVEAPPVGPARKVARSSPRPGRAQHLALSSSLFVLIDVVIDPVALRGDRWFLGQIYGYPEPGVYFGVPLTNFLGWGVVGVTATTLYHVWERRHGALATTSFTGWAALCPGLYYLVLAFNLGVTSALGEWRLFLSGVLITLPVILWTLAILVRPRPVLLRAPVEGRRA